MVREDSPTLRNLRMAIREGQDAGDLPLNLCQVVGFRSWSTRSRRQS